MRPTTAASAAQSGHFALTMRATRLRGGSAVRRLMAVVSAAILAGATLASPNPVAGVAPTGNAAFPDLPVGFAKVQLAAGLKNPTAIAFAPNGDIYIAQQRGAIRLYRGGVVLPPPVATLNTDTLVETGVLGLALDPNFASNGYMYVAYTTPDEHAQLSRFTITGGGTTASLASEVVFWRGNQLQAAHHSVNDVHIGPDGKLWVSVGDNDPAITSGAALTNAYGKILRFNLDGSIPSDNPFLTVPGAAPSIYAYGLRNPFRFTFLPDGRAMTEDTGSNFWEELDTIQKGGNYGWDFYEGNCFSCGYINPAYAYGHNPVDAAASAMAAYSGNAFPAQYAHTVFVGDYVRRDIEAVQFDPTYTTEISQTVFDSSVGTIADLQEGPDGALYYVSIYEGQFWKIYPTGSLAPIAAASATPSAGPAPLSVQFSSAGSSDPYGLPLTYSWDFGDGTPVSTSPNPGHSYGSNGTYTATLTVGNGTSTATATTQVVVGNSAPVAAITSPAVNATYNGGDTVSFSGTVSDAVDGALPASAYTWKVDLYKAGVAQPSYLAGAPGPFYGPTSGVTGGSFQVPTDNSNTPGTFYRITMTVVDSLGLSTVVTRDIHPNLTSWTVGSNVPGSLVFVDGTLQHTPYTTSDVVGIKHVLMGLPSQTVGSTRYRLNGWADGSDLADTFVSSAAPVTLSQVLDPVTTATPAGWTSADIGNPLMAGTTDYSVADHTFYVDGSGSDIYGAKDQFHYVYESLTGDGTIVARVRYQSNTDPWAKAGLMFKESPTTGATWIDALVTPDVSSNTPNTNGVNCTPNGCDAPLPPVIPTVGNGVRMQYTPSSSIAPAPLPGYSYPNKWLKMQRAGSTFTSWQSNDGVTWTQIGKKTLTIAASATVGLFVTSHNVGQISSVGFDNVSVTGAVVLPPNDFSISANPMTVSVVAGTSGSTGISTAVVSGTPESIALSSSGLPAGVTATFNPASVTTGAASSVTFSVAGSVAAGTYPISVLGASPSTSHPAPVSLTVTAAGGLPSPWLDTDVGAPSPAGSATYVGGVFSVAGSGADIFGTNDQFNYVYQPSAGNGTLIARVTSQTNTGSTNSKAGIIWKSSTVAGSPYILIETGPTGAVKVQYNFNGTVSGATFGFPNLWMKLVRSGGNFSAYTSPDGVAWTALVVTNSLPTITTSATVGIFECSHKPGVLGTATFDNVSFVPGP